MITSTGLDFTSAVPTSPAVASAAAKEPLISTENLAVCAETFPLAALTASLNAPPPVFEPPLLSSVNDLAMPLISKLTFAPATLNPDGTENVPLNPIESALLLAKFSLIEALVSVSGRTLPAVAGPPVGESFGLLGSVPTAASNESENPSPS